MIFAEKKTKKGYHYKVEDVFGEMEFESSKKLNANILDQVFMAIFKLHKNDGAKDIKGEIKEINLIYKYNKKSQWIQTEKKLIKYTNSTKEYRSWLSQRVTYIKKLWSTLMHCIK